MLTREQQSKVCAVTPHFKAELEGSQSHDPRHHVGMMLVAEMLVLECAYSVWMVWAERFGIEYDA